MLLRKLRYLLVWRSVQPQSAEEHSETLCILVQLF